MQHADESLRAELASANALEGHHYVPAMLAIHEQNAARLTQILDTHGWPHEQLVFADGAYAAWLSAQHAICDPPLQRRALALLEKESSLKTSRAGSRPTSPIASPCTKAARKNMAPNGSPTPATASSALALRISRKREHPPRLPRPPTLSPPSPHPAPISHHNNKPSSAKTNTGGNVGSPPAAGPSRHSHRTAPATSPRGTGNLACAEKSFASPSKENGAANFFAAPPELSSFPASSSRPSLASLRLPAPCETPPAKTALSLPCSSAHAY